MSDETYWRTYWSTRRDGGHRHSSDEFLDAEAREKLALLDGGDSLLDFGCGAAEMLVRYAPSYTRAVGCDFSAAMLAEGRARLDRGGHHDVELVEADDRSVWAEVDGAFDRITAGQVVQYFDEEQLSAFLATARSRLTADGRIVLFDVIDPRIGYLFALGVLGAGGRGHLGASLAIRGVRHWARTTRRRARGLPPLEIGWAHHPARLAELAAQHGLVCDIAWSRFYEYRFHALLAPNRQATSASR